MNIYREKINSELADWKHQIAHPPAPSFRTIKRIQRKLNRLIPHQVHTIITHAIKDIVRAVLYGAEFSTPKREGTIAIHHAEEMIRETIWFYSSSAAAQGAITGLGGLVSSVADFPLWLSIKMKMLFEIAKLYGYDTKDFQERLFILHVFQLAFSSRQRKLRTYDIIANWDEMKAKLPQNIHEFNWHGFQLEYRNNLDLIKLFQMIPGIGAVVGGCTNHKLTYRLGKTAMNAYRLRKLNSNQLSPIN
ncbi:EcsC family protein [Reichenbachiella agariperforans]|uniref:EcsC family protein n=1 Tax=Reichenbachiella agariperforans TaxID=156994 RepID=UPI001C09CCAE|nr:EcsC family protein [Reichenbachiella agariperforans]